MRALVASVFLIAPLLAGVASAEPFALAPDGSTVVRLKSLGAISSSSFDMSLLNGGFSGMTGAVGAVSVTDYRPGYAGDAGGAAFAARVTSSAPLESGQSLNWLQVVQTNAPRAPITATTYLDNQGSFSSPFYPNSTFDPIASSSVVEDQSVRSPQSFALHDPLSWSASLYPVIADGQALTIGDGVAWGYEMKRAPVGDVSTVFTDASINPAFVNGLGTSSVDFHLGLDSLSFSAARFDTLPNTPFSIGTLSFLNGSGLTGGESNTFQFESSVHFDNVPEADFGLRSFLTITELPRIDHPHDGAQIFGKTISLGAYDYTAFAPLGETTTVNLWAILTTNLSGYPYGADTDASITGFNSEQPHYVLTFVGFSDPRLAGSVPEPMTWGLMILGLLATGQRLRRARRYVCA